MDRPPVLVVTGGTLKGRRYEVTGRGLIVGRDAVCDVVVDDRSVSRQHARLILHNGSVWVQDSGSRNGVFVNGQRVVRHRQLAVGDQLAVGAHVFALEVRDRPDAPAPPAAHAPTPREPPASSAPPAEEPPAFAPRRVVPWALWLLAGVAAVAVVVAVVALLAVAN